MTFFRETVAERRSNPGGTDLISALLEATAPANDDPEVFENPHEFIIDRAQNRRVAFGDFRVGDSERSCVGMRTGPLAADSADHVLIGRELNGHR